MDLDVLKRVLMDLRTTIPHLLVALVMFSLGACQREASKQTSVPLVEVQFQDTSEQALNVGNLDFFQFFLEISYPELTEDERHDPELLSHVFDRFTEDLVLAGMAMQHEKTVSEKEIDDFIQLELTHMTFKLQTPQVQAFYRREIRKRLLIRAFLKEEILSRIAITEEDAQAYYNEHSNEFMIEPKFCIRQVQFEDEEQAKAFRKDLNAGQMTFKEVAESHKEEADVHELAPCLPLASFPEPFQKTIRNLRSGAISKVLKLDYADKTLYHVLMLERKIPSVEYSFEETLPKIKSILEKEEIEKLLTTKKNTFLEQSALSQHFKNLPFQYVPIENRRSDS